MIKEFREFFLRNAQVNVGTKPDQETSFPVKYIVKSKQVFNRFLKDHYPTENVFKKLFESITFKLNKEDTANYNGIDIQGLVKLANDEDTQTRNSRNSATDFSIVVQPHQLPIITTQENVEAIITAGILNVYLTNTLTYQDITFKVYSIQISAGVNNYKEYWAFSNTLNTAINSLQTVPYQQEVISGIDINDGVVTTIFSQTIDNSVIKNNRMIIGVVQFVLEDFEQSAVTLTLYLNDVLISNIKVLQTYGGTNELQYFSIPFNFIIDKTSLLTGNNVISVKTQKAGGVVLIDNGTLDTYDIL